MLRWILGIFLALVFVQYLALVTETDYESTPAARIAAAGKALWEWFHMLGDVFVMLSDLLKHLPEILRWLRATRGYQAFAQMGGSLFDLLTSGAGAGAAIWTAAVQFETTGDLFRHVMGAIAVTAIAGWALLTAYGAVAGVVAA